MTSEILETHIVDLYNKYVIREICAFCINVQVLFLFLYIDFISDFSFKKTKLNKILPCFSPIRH